MKKILSTLLRPLPDIYCRFATFQHTNFHNGYITKFVQLCPRSIFFCVDTPVQTKPALQKLLTLNPGVEWYWRGVNYTNGDKEEHNRVLIELCLSKIPMRVSTVGNLICIQPFAHQDCPVKLLN